MPEILTIATSHDTRPSASLTAVVEHCVRQKIKKNYSLYR
jgi:hypothetical protein